MGLFPLKFLLSSPHKAMVYNGKSNTDRLSTWSRYHGSDFYVAKASLDLNKIYDLISRELSLGFCLHWLSENAPCDQNSYLLNVVPVSHFDNRKLNDGKSHLSQS